MGRMSFYLLSIVDFEEKNLYGRISKAINQLAIQVMYHMGWGGETLSEQIDSMASFPISQCRVT